MNNKLDDENNATVPLLTNESSIKDDDKNNLNSTFLSNYNDTNNSFQKNIKKNINKSLGHFYNLASIFGFFISNILTKVQYLYAPNLSVELSQLYRSLIITFLSMFHIFLSRHDLNFDENFNNKRILFLNSLFGNLIYIFYFLACFYLRLGTANALLYSYPLFSFLFAYFILKEKIHKIDIIGLIIGFFSILVILHFGSVEKPFEDDSLLNSQTSTFITTMLGIIFGFLGAINISAKTVICKQSAHININLHFLLFWMGLLGVVIGIAGFFYSTQPIILDIPLIIVSIILGVSAYYANVFHLESFKHITVVESLIPGFLTIILSFVLGKYIFNNDLDWLDITGSSLLIVFSYFYIRHKVYMKEHINDE